MESREKESRNNVMPKPHRLAAGGFVFKRNAVLLVRYRKRDEGTYLMRPGGLE
jgi:hypothetical protein